MRAIFAFALCPRDRVGGMGQAGEGVGSVQLQAAHQPHRAHRVRSWSRLHRVFDGRHLLGGKPFSAVGSPAEP